jgi:ParB-like chromosome segregation protein Spo0J
LEGIVLMGEKQWANRIVGHGDVDPETLIANAKNYRIHPTNQRNALKGSIDDIGFSRSILITQTGTVLDGHLRVALALSEHQKTIPVEIVDLNEAEADEALLLIDPLAAMAGQDKEKLDALLREVQSGDAAVQQMLADMAKAAGLVYGKKPVDAGVDYIPAQWMVLIECKSEQEQNVLLQRFIDEGLQCKALTS